MRNKIIEGILKKLKIPGLVESLTDTISTSELTSLLLAVFDRKVEGVSPSALFHAYKTNVYGKPSDDDPVLIRKLDLAAFSLLTPVFEALDVSPVIPLGTCSAIGTVDQKKVLSALRGTEVVADVTNSLALEAALRRVPLLHKGGKNTTVHLCAGHRQIRTQPLISEHFRPHFYVFGLCSAGHDTGNLEFEVDMLYKHLSFYIDFFAMVIKKDAEYTLGIELSDFTGKGESMMTERLFPRLLEHYPHIPLKWNNEREHAKNYYNSFCFAMPCTIEGNEYHYIDGGLTDWTARLLGNRKERVLTSGISFTYMLNTIGNYMSL